MDNRNYEYEETDETDATDYLLSSDAMKDHLKKSIQQAKDGQVSTVPLDDLWK